MQVYAEFCISQLKKMQRTAFFKERLVARRHRLNFGQKELAEKAGVAPRSIAAWESGESEPSLDSLDKLAAALETTIAWLVGDVPADEGLSLRDAARPVWPMLSERTLRAVVTDLSQHDGSDPMALMHLERVVGELRLRASKVPIKGVSSKTASVAAELMDAAGAAATGENPPPERSPKSEAGEPTARKGPPARGVGKGS